MADAPGLPHGDARLYPESQDTIRKAVELADGWEIHGLTGFSTPESGSDNALDDICNMQQMEKDALAAQLYRQCVDAGHSVAWLCNGIDTIRDIIDSKVLENEQG